MAINFPSNPTNSQEITEGNVTYVYNATKGYWESSEGSSSGASTTVYADMTALIAATGMSNGDQAFVTGNNNLYIYSGSGWYKVATVQQDAPSAITGVSGTYELAVDGTATTITAVSTDPEGFPLTWSYSTSGLGSIATISQSDNVFTITPSTTVSDVGTFSLTINATDGVNGAVSTTTNLTLEFIIIVTNSKYTTLLATAVDTSDNNDITDASTNNHTITANGDAHAGTFSPYRSGGYSTYFDGTGDYLSISSNASLNFNYDAFTIEFWVQSSVKTDFQTVVAKYDSSDNTGVFILLNSSGNVLFGANPSSSNYITTSGTDVCDGAWHHITCTRSVSSGVGTMTVYIDGSSAGTLNRLDNAYNTVDFEIGRQNAVINRPLTGYVSDLRVVKGTAITPPSGGPTERLEAVTNTSLLTCHLPYIIDGSTNSHSITVNGDVSTKPFSPYDYVEYSATDHGGSLHFNGTNSAVEIADNDDFDFGTGDFTIECWVYPEVTGNNFPGFLGTTAGWGSVAASGFRFDNLADSKFQMSWYGPGDPFLETQSTYLHDQWYHFVVTRTGGNTWRMFINGILEDVATNSTPYDICVGGHNLQVGGKTWDGGNGWFKGNVADLRLTKGSIVTEYQTSSAAIGTRIFTPRTTPITSSGSELHIKGTDASIIDKSQGSNLNLVGNTTGSTTQVKFNNTKSMYFDGTGDYILSHEPVKFGTQDFTAECWLYYESGLELMGNRTTSDSGGFSVRITSTSVTVGNSSGSGFGSVFSGTTSSLTNAWHHIAVSRSSGVTKIYVDGTSIASHSNSINFSLSNPFVIGYAYTNSSGADSIQGYIQDFRVTTGLARYTANFTPPTASLKG